MILFLSACTKQPDQVTTIPILNGPCSVANEVTLLKNAKVFPLETTSDCLISNDFYFLNCIDDYYILDASAKTVSRFNPDGKFMNAIGKTGKGPGEYVRLYEGIITGSTVELLSGFPQTEIYSYSRDGAFLSKRSLLEYPSWSFILCPGLEKYFFYGSFFEHKILSLNQSTGEKADSMLENSKETQAMSMLAFSSSGKASVLFWEPVINKVFEITQAGIREKYRLELGNYSFEMSPTGEELGKRTQDPGLWVTLKVLENQKYVYLYTSKSSPGREPSYIHFIYRKGDKTLWTLPEDSGFSASLGPGFSLTETDDLYAYLKPSEAVESETWRGFFKSRKQSLAADHNPVVVVFKLDLVEQK